MTKIIGVIHHRDLATTIKNAIIGHRCGFDGFALISMTGNDTNLFEPAKILKKAYSDKNIGMNLLTFSPGDAFITNLSHGMDFTWIDNPGVSSSQVDKTIESWNRGRDRKHLIFGSVAFKTQHHEEHPDVAAVIAHSLDWIPTTSGPTTGVAPDIEKLHMMKKALPLNGQLAVASGVTPDNIKDMKRYVDWVLVATGISSNFYEYDPNKCLNLVKSNLNR